MQKGLRYVGWAICLSLAMVVVTAHGGGRQKSAPQPSPSLTIPAHPEDVRSEDSILSTFYSSVSGPAGKPRDWDRLRSLFVPGARFVTVGHGPDAAVLSQNFSVEEYITRAAPVLEKEGFVQNEVSRHTERYAHISQVFSTYEARHNNGEAPFQRGINSIQLMNDGQRWWVVTVFWEPEIPGSPIPDKFLN